MKLGNRVSLKVKINWGLWGIVSGKTNEKITNKLLLTPIRIRLSITPTTNIKYGNR